MWDLLINWWQTEKVNHMIEVYSASFRRDWSLQSCQKSTSWSFQKLLTDPSHFQDYTASSKYLFMVIHLLVKLGQVCVDCPNNCIQWNLWCNTTALRDRPPMRDHFSRNLGLYFYSFLPPMKNHLSYKSSLLWSHGGLKSQVSLYMLLCQLPCYTIFALVCIFY